jgi:predicted aminopeptidase
VADPRTDPRTRARLELVASVRHFASESLQLPAGRSYQTYADLGRQDVVFNVVATPEFSVVPRRWCFPIAGCVAYRGYFDEQRARDFALKLSIEGDDVIVGGVPTYSTLGHLPDPVFAPMLQWRDARLAGTIFHELAHARLYVAGDSEFNEAFASVVEEEGVRRWLEATGRSEDLDRFALAADRETDFAHLLRDTRSRLSKLYKSGLAVDAMRIEKQREFGRLKFEYEQLRTRWGGYTGYDAWFARSLNNADLAAIATYRDCMPGIQKELDAAASLPEFYERMDEVARMPAKRRHEALCRRTMSASVVN